MRRLGLLLGLVVVLAAFVSSSATGASQRPSVTARWAAAGASSSVGSQVASGYAVPAYCSPCLYYSGDFNANDPNANALSNENDLLVPGARVYQPVRPDRDWFVTGMFVNVLASPGVIDPADSQWKFRTGVSAGVGGMDYASGVGASTITATGRSGFGFPEYTLFVKLPQTVRLHQGVTYWFNAQPQCTNGGDVSCNGRFFESDIEPVGAHGINHYGPPNIYDDSFFNSAFFGFNFDPTWGPTGACGGVGCDAFSVGLTGHPKLYKV